MDFSFLVPTAEAATTLVDVAPSYSPGSMVTTGVAIVVMVAVICAVLFIVWWGVMLILSGGKDEKVKPAINSIRYSVIGLIVIVIALFVTPKIVEFMGLSQLNAYLSPNVIFSSMRDIANGIFWGNGFGSSYTSPSQPLDSLDSDFSDL